jgi:hypothetical protein
MNMNTKDRGYGIGEEVSIIAKPEDERGETDSNLLMSFKELERFPVADGYIVMVEQHHRRIGFAAVGLKAWETLNVLVNRFSPLETYLVLGGDSEKAPAWLMREHAIRYLGNPAAQKPRSLPSLDEIVGISQPMFGFSQDLGLVSGSACVSGNTPCLDYFEDYFNSFSAMFNNGIPWVNFGDNGISGNGTWQNGDANLNLGPTSAGVAAVCFCSEQGYLSSAEVTVQEYAGQGVWLDLWTSSGFAGAAYGILFKGFAIRRIRLLVRDNEANEGKPFSWCGSF